MRTLIMWNMVTLDGYFEGTRPWDIGWHEYVWGDELERFSLDQTATADLLLFGRVTYEGMAAHWTTAEGEVADVMNSISKVVFSNTLEAADWNNTRLVNGPAEEEVARLKQQSGENILVFGSADLSATLMEHDLIDEYRLCVVPIVLGEGNPLFKTPPEPVKMQLVSARPLRSGCVILSYRPDEIADSDTAVRTNTQSQHT